MDICVPERRTDQPNLFATGTGRVNVPSSVQRSVSVLQIIFGDAFTSDFDVRCWDGTLVPARQARRFALRLNAPFAARADGWVPTHLRPNCAVAHTVIGLEGDDQTGIDAFTAAVDSIGVAQLQALIAVSLRRSEPGRLSDLRIRNSSGPGERAPGTLPSSQPASLHRMFFAKRPELGESPDPVAPAGAQLIKIDYLQRKVRLVPGELQLGAECVWGSLVIRIAKHFGTTFIGLSIGRA